MKKIHRVINSSTPIYVSGFRERACLRLDERKKKKVEIIKVKKRGKKKRRV